MVHIKKGCTKGCTTKEIVIRKTLVTKGFFEVTQYSNSSPQLRAFLLGIAMNIG